MKRFLPIPLLAAMLALRAAGQSPATPPTIHVDWSQVIGTTRTTITLQVVENPPLRRGSSIHDAAWSNLAALNTQMTRLALWYPYPRLAVAELAPPTAAQSSWDFTNIDPIVDDFLHATGSRTSVFTFSTIPNWMFCDTTQSPLPPSADEAVWSYESGSRLCDPTGREAAAYFARVASWYTRGGFHDEHNLFHTSTHHDHIAWWEVLNEPEYEHAFDVRTYTRLYDRITAAVHAVSPGTRFVGLSLAEPMRAPAAFEYFLNPAHHAPHTSIDAVSFHFYADAEAGETAATEPYTFFDHADAFINTVGYIDAIRQRLSPHTQLQVNEAGCIDASDLHLSDAPPPSADSHYWNLCGAVFAYLYSNLAAEHVDLLGASQLIGYPSQFPSVTLLNWAHGTPNARYRVLQLLHQNLGPGNRIIRITSPSPTVSIAAYIANGHRTLLLINKRSDPITLTLPDWDNATESHVDVTTQNTVAHSRLTSHTLTLNGLAVTVIRW